MRITSNRIACKPHSIPMPLLSNEDIIMLTHSTEHNHTHHAHGQKESCWCFKAFYILWLFVLWLNLDWCILYLWQTGFSEEMLKVFFPWRDVACALRKVWQCSKSELYLFRHKWMAVLVYSLKIKKKGRRTIHPLLQLCITKCSLHLNFSYIYSALHWNPLIQTKCPTFRFAALYIIMIGHCVETQKHSLQH